MDEYISKSYLITKFNELADKYAGNEHKRQRELAYATAADMIKLMDAADVQAVKHGYWEEITDYGGWGDTHYRCSVCGEEWYLEDGKPKDNNMNFCPRCGAKMDAESDEPWQSE